MAVKRCDSSSGDETGGYLQRSPADSYAIEVLDKSAGKAWTTVSSSDTRAPFDDLLARRRVRKQISRRTSTRHDSRGPLSLPTTPSRTISAQEEPQNPGPVGRKLRCSRPAAGPTFVLDRGDVRARGDTVGPSALTAVTSLDPDLFPRRRRHRSTSSVATGSVDGRFQEPTAKSRLCQSRMAVSFRGGHRHDSPKILAITAICRHTPSCLTGLQPTS
ncbi:MAG: hypothetical protein Ct9H300mP1_01050 [Planctomycetaceae bacterium]|nr:MAG: hypothetical protein Ct9H300mP1_01050 [Planctomycetaceae bacterium]